MEELANPSSVLLSRPRTSCADVRAAITMSNVASEPRALARPTGFTMAEPF
jgi:hypothetical protein